MMDKMRQREILNEELDKAGFLFFWAHEHTVDAQRRDQRLMDVAQAAMRRAYDEGREAQKRYDTDRQKLQCPKE